MESWRDIRLVYTTRDECKCAELYNPNHAYAVQVLWLVRAEIEESLPLITRSIELSLTDSRVS